MSNDSELAKRIKKSSERRIVNTVASEVGCASQRDVAERYGDGS